MTVRHAVLPIGALLVLGLGVYLFVEVRAQPAPAPPMPATTIDHPARPLRPAEPAVQQAAVLGDASATAPPRSSDRPARTPSAAPATRDPGVPAPEPETPTSGPKLDAAMDEANKAYDRGDFEDAKALAGRLLARLPTNVRMLRIMVSASCIDGDSAVAQLHFAKLPPADQEQMRVRCARYGVAFADRP